MGDVFFAAQDMNRRPMGGYWDGFGGSGQGDHGLLILSTEASAQLIQWIKDNF